jgi:hypothetical protein
MHFVEAFVFFSLALIAFVWIQARMQEVEYVKSVVDDRTYLVRRLPDSQRAADELARLNQDAMELIKHLVAKFDSRSEAHAVVQRLYERFNPNAMSEGSADSGYTSYSISKGKKMVMCIRQRDHAFVDHNTLMFVLCHELAHVMTETVGHDASFWTNFRLLLREAVAIGVYVQVDYSKMPEDFCGIKISSTVLKED